MIRVETVPTVVCDVCRLVDGDLSLKYCYYCSLCDSWICERDNNNWWRRGKAFLIRKLEPGFKGDPSYKVPDVEPKGERQSP